MWRQRQLVGPPERGCKLLRSAGINVGAKGLGGKVQTSSQPKETFGGGVLLGGKFRLDEGLKGRAFEW